MRSVYCGTPSSPGVVIDLRELTGCPALRLDVGIAMARLYTNHGYSVRLDGLFDRQLETAMISLREARVKE